MIKNDKNDKNDCYKMLKNDKKCSIMLYNAKNDKKCLLPQVT